MSNTDIVPPHDLLAKITVLHKKDIQIYKPKTEPGPKSNQYRDCVDLAAKIAFGLNQMQDWIELDLNHVKTWEVIKELSNNSIIDTNIIISDLPLRIKQTSDIRIVHTFNEIEKTLNTTLETVKAFSQKMYETNKTKYNDYCDQVGHSDQVLADLVTYHGACVEELHEALNVGQQRLLGLVNEIYTEGGT